MSESLDRGWLQYPRLTEIAGPAGSGKSTLVERLTARPGVMTPEPPRRADSLKALARALAGPWTGLDRISCDRAVIRSLAHLDHWARLSITPKDGVSHFVIDQGPVYRIVQVTDRLGLPRSGSSWWSDQLRIWAETLDTVVYLDAPDDILLDRVTDRGKHHRLENLSEKAAGEELARIRALFGESLDTLENRGVPILRVDTRSLDPAEVERAIGRGLGVGR